jgi:D-tagatose-1,6-bisphosphate aldolase subunit GatZ/KbaZ
VTRPEDAARTLELTRAAFGDGGLDAAWERVVALVVQPGVEFGDAGVHRYDPAAARGLAALLEGVPGVVFEAHSTDFQDEHDLAALVRDHFAILKAGPCLTFAFREAVFALAATEEEWLGRRPGVMTSGLPSVVDEAMRRDPIHWKDYYRGDDAELCRARQVSLCDRIRYYWSRSEVRLALERLLANLEADPPPLTLLAHHLPGPCGALEARGAEPRPREIIDLHLREVIDRYTRACGIGPQSAETSSVTAN